MMAYSDVARSLLQRWVWLVSMMLSGCTVLPSNPGLQSYLLPAHPQAVEGNQRQLAQTVRVTLPETSQFLNSVRIAVVPQGNEISVYKGVRWSDPLPTLLRNRLVREFREGAQMQGVSGDPGLPADVELRSYARAFQGVYQGSNGVVLFQLDASLVNMRDRSLIASHSFEVSQPIQGTDMEKVVTAFGLAGDQLAAQVVQWTVQQMSRGAP